MIPVAVTISVAVSGAEGTEVGGVGAVEDQSHVAVAAGIVEVLDLGEHLALEEACADYEEGHVGVGVDDLGIRHHLHRRTVKQYVVVTCAQIVKHGFQTRGIEHFRRVGRQCAYRDQIQSLGLVGTAHHDILKRGMPRKVCADTTRRASDIRAQRCLAQVKIHHCHAMSFYGEDCGKVHGYESLA